MATFPARIRFALRHLLWPRWCARHALPYASDFCPECNGARLARLEVVDERNTAHASGMSGMSGESATQIGLARLLAFDPAAVARHVRGGRRNGLHRALESGEISGR